MEGKAGVINKETAKSLCGGGGNVPLYIACTRANHTRLVSKRERVLANVSANNSGI